MKIGDKFKVGYICDCHKHNYEEGIISWVHPFRYYPNGDINNHIIKTQIKVGFSDGESIMITQ